MSVPFIERPPTAQEIELLRLTLSTFQDGSGMINLGSGETLPGWRDFERAIAWTFDGLALESKAIYDVLLPVPESPGLSYGISCKSRQELRLVDQDGRITIELSNAAGEFWDMLRALDIHEQNYAAHAERAGQALIQRVSEWHSAVDVSRGGGVITARSIFLSLQYQRKNREYQLFQFPIQLPDPKQIEWAVFGRHLIGRLAGRVILEWYGLSGGQLKYYPHQDTAAWKSERFWLEPLPQDLEAGVRNKIRTYFPERWERLQKAGGEERNESL